jgi:hypothetical protein
MVILDFSGMTKPAQDFRTLQYHNVDLLSFNVFGEEKFSWLPSKNKVADENLHFQRHTNISNQITMFSFFICQYVFRRQPAEFFFSQNIPQMKAGQNNKYDTTKT